MSRCLALLFLCLLGLNLPAQQDKWQRIAVPDAMDIEVDEEGNIWLLDPLKARIHKVLAANAYDSLISIGGRSVGGEALIAPSRIRLLGRVGAWVLDRSTRRLVRLNANLQPNTTLDFLALERPQDPRQQLPGQLNPMAFDVGPTGEMFVLNQDDNLIYKFDQFGRFELSFGGSNYGDGSLREPFDLRITSENMLMVPDSSLHCVSQFDNFGIFRQQICPELPWKWLGMAMLPPLQAWWNDTVVVLRHQSTGQTASLNLPPGPPVRDLVLRTGRVYILREKEVVLWHNP